MEGTLDIQRDHGRLIRDTMTLLAPGGTLYFSTNRRSFRLDTLIEGQFDARDITAQTLDEDFKRPPPAHRCWAIRRHEHRKSAVQGKGVSVSVDLGGRRTIKK